MGGNIYLAVRGHHGTARGLFDKIAVFRWTENSSNRKVE
jgi:hypothetical protein